MIIRFGRCQSFDATFTSAEIRDVTIVDYSIVSVYGYISICNFLTAGHPIYANDVTDCRISHFFLPLAYVYIFVYLP